MEQVLCQASKRDFGGWGDDRASSAKAINKFVYVTFGQGLTSHQLSAQKEPMGGHLLNHSD
jgi:hypothetical protein